MAYFIFTRKFVKACILVSIALALSIPSQVLGQSTASSSLVLADSSVYLPLVVSNQDHIVIGVYTKGYIGHQSVINTEIKAMDSWTTSAGGKPVSMLATFIDLEETGLFNTLIQQLEIPWQNGYSVFINLGSTHTASEIATGVIDDQIRFWAGWYKNWTDRGEGRWSIIAPLQEMNGNWVPYGRDPVNYKLAYLHIQTLFQEAGIPSNSIRWAFAPNGYENPGDPKFEEYYPGDAFVNIIGFSSYNFGYCPSSLANRVPKWETAEQIYGPYISRMRAMASSKPIFIVEMATTSYSGLNHLDPAAKNQWLVDTYQYLSKQKIKGILYLNKDDECDWAFYMPGRQLNGYPQAVAGQEFSYTNPFNLINLFP